jgi:hypothetical protein
METAGEAVELSSVDCGCVGSGVGGVHIDADIVATIELDAEAIGAWAGVGGGGREFLGEEVCEYVDHITTFPGKREITMERSRRRVVGA